MTDPRSLYRLEADSAQLSQHAPLLVVALEGFLDAGQVRNQLVDHVLGTLEHSVVASFEVDELIDYRHESIRDRVRELTGGLGADVVFDPVGGDAFDQALRAVNWEARMLVIGFAGGRIQSVPANLVLVDPTARAVVDPDGLASRSRNSPYAGRELPGRVVATFLRGVPTVLDGKAQR